MDTDTDTDTDTLKYRKVVVNGEVIAGEDVIKIFPPTPESLTWRFILKKGIMIEATGNVTVYINKTSPF